MKQCACQPGCVAWTASHFAPGHDAKMVSWLRRQVAEGRMTVLEAQAQAVARGSSFVLAERVRKACERVNQREFTKR